MADNPGHTQLQWLRSETSCWIPSETGKMEGPSKQYPIRISYTEVRNFIFGSLELTDDDTLLEDPFSSGNIGEIKVVFERAKATSQCLVHISLDSIPKTGKVTNVRRKGWRTKSSRYNELVTMNSGQCLAFCEYGVIATFIFKYRPLVKQEVTDDEDEVDELDDDDDVLAREKALLAELEKVRNERRARKEAGRPKKKVKKEPVTYFTPEPVLYPHYFIVGPLIIQLRMSVSRSFSMSLDAHGGLKARSAMERIQFTVYSLEPIPVSVSKGNLYA
ncbi:hypothetical protein BDZ97DRAFT_1752787 [Flammula alnicola]|nr:hypothetical protein BDZ97DRAFT_1752787 [Flammula alnicola]